MVVKSSNVAGTCGLRCEGPASADKSYDGLSSDGANQLSGGLLRRLTWKARRGRLGRLA